MTYRELLIQGTEQLEIHGIQDPKTDAWLLMEACFSIDRMFLLMNGVSEADGKTASQYLQWIERRSHHEPLQYIIGRAPFMGFEFEVNPSVLIPRFDTEVLVSEAILRIRQLQVEKSTGTLHVLDMCTGSGCIAISLSKLTECLVTGVDISPDALEVARRNAHRLETGFVDFVEGNLFDKITDSYDMIVSNPPYIPPSVIETLDMEVREHEPRIALDGHEDGLYFYRILTQESLSHLSSGGYLMYEIGCELACDVMHIMEDNGFTEVQVIKDLAGLDRVVVGRR